MACQLTYRAAPRAEDDTSDEPKIDTPLNGVPVPPGWAPKRALLATASSIMLGVAFVILLGGKSVPMPLAKLSGATQLQATAADPCADFARIRLDLLSHSNLGKKGPDSGAEGLAYEGVDTGPGSTGKTVILTVNATTPFTTGNPLGNGFAVNNFFAAFNQVAGTQATFIFSLFDKATKQPLILPVMYFTFFDLDMSLNLVEKEYIKVGGFVKADMMEKTEVKTTSNSDGTMTFWASTGGTGADNPTDPLALTVQQKNRAVTLTFQQVSTFTAEIGSVGNAGNTRGFTFVAFPSVLCAKTKDGDAGNTASIDSTGNKVTTVTTTTVAPTTTAEAKKCWFTIPIINFCVPKFF